MITRQLIALLYIKAIKNPIKGDKVFLNMNFVVIGQWDLDCFIFCITIIIR
ncbi:MAG: hypothetical protein PWP30_1295 [Eubacteriaceae bacterium]|nr:hypothetical protein [Eubacteriaceae bacterium]